MPINCGTKDWNAKVASIAENISDLDPLAPHIDEQLAKEVLDRTWLPDRATKLPTRPRSKPVNWITSKWRTWLKPGQFGSRQTFSDPPPKADLESAR